MRIQPFSAEVFDNHLRHSSDYLKALRAKNQNTVLVADNSVKHIEIAQAMNIALLDVASAAHIAWVNPDELEYFRTGAGTSLSEKFESDLAEDEITVGLLVEIIKSAGIAKVEFNIL